MKTIDEKFLDQFTRAYIEAAFFTETGDTDQPPADAELSQSGFDDAKSDCADFLTLINTNGLFDEYLKTYRPIDSMAHDFWFSRNGHGVGFWDRGMGKLGDDLHNAAKSFGEHYLYAGDDNLVYFG
jgi:hypothetical protein